jgi:hypothetical protein
MADSGSPPDAPQSAPSGSFLARLIGVFVEPGATFDEIARKPDFIAPLILLMLVSVAVAETMLAKIGIDRIILQTLKQSGRAAGMDPEQLNQTVQKAAAFGRVMMQISTVVGVPIFMLVVAGFGLVVLNFIFGESAGFKEVFSATCYASMPRVVGGVMAIAVMFFGDPDYFRPTSPAPTNLGFFVNPLTTSPAVLTLASALDILTLWFLVLLAIGLSRVSRKKVRARSIFITFFGAWVLLVLARAGFALLAG